MYYPCLRFSPSPSRACTSRDTHPQHPSSSAPSELPPTSQRLLPSGTPDEPVFPGSHPCPHGRAGLAQSLIPSTLLPLPHLPPVPPCGSESNNWLLFTSSSLGIRSSVLPSLANDSPPAELSPLLRTRLVHGGHALPSLRRVGSAARPPTHTPTALPASFTDLLVPSQEYRPLCRSNR